MATRTAYHAIAATTLTAVNLDRYPGGWIGHAEVTSNQGGITTTTDLSGLSLTVTVGTSRRIMVTGFIPSFSSTVSDAYAELTIVESSTTLGKATGAAPTSGFGVAIVVQSILTPSAGSHTYKLQLASVTAGTITMSASANYPAFILVEDLGPSS